MSRGEIVVEQHSFAPTTLLGIALVIAPTAWLMVRRPVEAMETAVQ